VQRLHSSLIAELIQTGSRHQITEEFIADKWQLRNLKIPHFLDEPFD